MGRYWEYQIERALLVKYLILCTMALSQQKNRAGEALPLSITGDDVFDISMPTHGALSLTPLLLTPCLLQSHRIHRRKRRAGRVIKIMDASPTQENIHTHNWLHNLQASVWMKM
jgi:hypothetical protein